VTRDQPRILVKKKLNQTNEVLLTIDFWSIKQMRSYVGITVRFISNEKKCYVVLAEDAKVITQLKTS